MSDEAEVLDLVIRCAECQSDEAIVHVPRSFLDPLVSPLTRTGKELKTWNDIKPRTGIVALDSSYQDATARRQGLEIELAEFEQSTPSRAPLNRLRIDRERIAVACQLGEATLDDLAAIDEAINTATDEYTSSLDEYNELVRLKREALQVLRDRERDALTASKRRHAEEARTAMADAWAAFDLRWTMALDALQAVMQLDKDALENGLCEAYHDYGRHGDPPYLYLNMRRYLDRLKRCGLLDRSATLRGDASPQDVREFQAQR